MLKPGTFDFRRSGWGHALHYPRIAVGYHRQAWWRRALRRRPRTFEYLTCLGHARPLPRESDILLVPMESGRTARFIVVEVRWMTDPDDMFEIKRADFVGWHDDREMANG